MIWKQANFDTLTGLPNRNMFHDRLIQEMTKADRDERPLALLLIDLDQFKEVNDTLGHDTGDLLLQEAGRRISDCVRHSDTVARLGGDEFTIILPELRDNSHIEDVAQKIIGKLEDAFQLGDEVAHISGSAGITLYPNDASDIDTLLKNADQAMYAAKNNGRNCFSYFTQSLQDSAQARRRLTNDLRSALNNNQFEVYYQPIINLKTGLISKAEALLRWHHHEHGFISPLDFIPLAEETGLIDKIGDLVLRQSIEKAKYWSNLFSNNFQISVNLSPIQFKLDNHVFTSRWGNYLHEIGLSGQNVVVEITEGLLLNAEPEIIDKLHWLRDAGIQVAIDDFGTCYSSLSYLKVFDIDYLKIDKSFVRNLESNENDIALCDAIILMAHTLGLKVIAEGVETVGQKKILANAGCDFAQGYLFSRPVPADEFDEILFFESAESEYA
jgi:diguanylate cyclase (GGDEF)-like protein